MRPEPMKLIPMPTPVFSRMVWVSPAAKARWGDAIHQINRHWYEIERELVATGYRTACQQPLNLQQYEETLRWAERRDLNVGIVRVVKPWQGFAHKYEAADPNDPTAYRVTAITNDSKVCAGFIMDGTLTDEEQGEAFGYPACCREWFSATFPAGYADPMWQMAQNSTSDCVDTVEDYKIVLKQNYLTNPLLRYVGLRLTIHIPCAINCKASEMQAVEVLGAIAQIGGQKLADDVKALLSMNLEFSVLKGIALIKTPVLQIANGSVPCYPKHTVQMVEHDSAKAYPECSAEGVVFPYRRKC